MFAGEAIDEHWKVRDASKIAGKYGKIRYLYKKFDWMFNYRLYLHEIDLIQMYYIYYVSCIVDDIQTTVANSNDLAIIKTDLFQCFE